MKTYSQPAEIKIGVVGYGGAFHIGRAHLTQAQAAGMTPTAVAEKDPERLQVAKADFPGIATFASLEEMLVTSDANLIVVITPHNTHAPLGLEVLNSGRHLVCEKPLAITTEEVDSLIASARRQNVMLSTFHNRHWDGRALTAVRDVVEQGLIGDLYKIDCRMGSYAQPRDWWRSSRSISGGILYDWGVHLLEYSLQLVRSDAVEVTGFARHGFWANSTCWKDDSNEDEACAMVRFANGVWLNLTITTLDTTPNDEFMRVHGTRGCFGLIQGQNRYRLTRVENGTSVTTEADLLPDATERYYQNIAAHLTGREDLVITPEWSRKPIAILDAAVRSAREGHAIRL